MIAVEAVVSILVLVGAFFVLSGALALARMPDLFMRLHGTTKATTLGVGGLLVAATLHLSATEPGVSLRELAIALFLLLTSPVSAHMLSRAALHLKTPRRAEPPHHVLREAPPADDEEP